MHVNRTAAVPPWGDESFTHSVSRTLERASEVIAPQACFKEMRGEMIGSMFGAGFAGPVSGVVGGIGGAITGRLTCDQVSKTAPSALETGWQADPGAFDPATLAGGRGSGAW